KDAIPLERFYTDRTGPSAVRSILKNFNFGFSTGYANTYLSHDIKGFKVFQPTSGAPQIFSDNIATRYGNWINDVNIDKSPVPAGTTIDKEISFKGNGLNIPFNLFIFYTHKQQYRVGLGYSYELLNIGSMTPSDNTIQRFQPSSSFGFVGKFYGFLGYSFHRWDEYLFTGDLQVGSFSPTNFNSSFVTTSTYFNLGVTAERELSEYLKFFVRPSFDFRSFDTAIPEGGKTISHSMNTLYFSVGVTYRIPELSKCFLSDCHAQINHAHGNKEYRSRRHPIYKKQNPGYGENDKTIIKYRGKNKKKLNPY
ncbi:MAG: hypothetical protein ACKOC0_07165, partial [Cytophagales bacterium]